MTKHSVHCTPYLRNHTSYDCHLSLWNKNTFRYFFYFFWKFWFLGGLEGGGGGVKGQKMIHNDKKLCLLGSIYHMIVICGANVYKMIIFLVVFFNFKILICQVVKGLKGQKVPQNVENFCLSHLVFWEPYIIWSSYMVHIYV